MTISSEWPEDPRQSCLMRGLCNDKLLAQSCVVRGNTFSIDHTLNGSCVGYLSIQHNELRDITVTLRINSAGVEPRLEPLSGSKKTADDARWCCCREFLRSQQMVYFDVKVFNPFSKFNVKEPLSQAIVIWTMKPKSEKWNLGALHSWYFLPLVDSGLLVTFSTFKSLPHSLYKSTTSHIS